MKNLLFKLGTSEGEYWLGYFIADGNMCKSGRSHRISISTMDKEVMEKYSKYSKCGVHQRPNKLYDMYFSSKYTFYYLENLGILPRKSLSIKLKFPLTAHVLRGIIDGDGSIHNSRACVKITTGSKELGEQIVDYLKLEGIFSKMRMRPSQPSCFDVWIERKIEYMKLFNLLYKDSDDSIRMNRKYQKFVAYISNNIVKGGNIGEG